MKKTMTSLCGILAMTIGTLTLAHDTVLDNQGFLGLRANSIIEGKLLHGLKVSPNEISEILISVDPNVLALTNHPAKLENCLISATVFPDFALERIKLRTNVLSCEITNSESEHYLQHHIKGYGIGSDNIAGVPVRVTENVKFHDFDGVYMEVDAGSKVSIVLLDDILLQIGN